MANEQAVGVADRAPEAGQLTEFPAQAVPAPPLADGGAKRAPQVVIYVPGLGHAPANSAERVADLFAAALDRRRPGSFAARKSVATAPRGLRAASSIFGDDPTTPAYEVFELDYQRKLTTFGEDPTTGATAPGFVRSCWYAAHAVRKVHKAWGKPTKTTSAKWQLFIGSFMATALGVFALLAAAAVLSGIIGYVLPSSVSLSVDVSQELALSGGSALAVAAAIWAWARPRIVAAAVTSSQLIDYLEEQRYRETITRTLDDAVDGLRDAGWGSSELSIIAYSFGSIVSLDALFPGTGQPKMRYDGFLRRLVTIGTSADMIRLYYPSYFDDREAQVPGLEWTNVYIPADVFGSSFDGATDPVLKPGDSSFAYTTERLSFTRVFRFRGFSTHAGYWGGVEEGSCFDRVLDKAFADALV